MLELEALEAREQQRAHKDAPQQRDSQGNLIQATSQPPPQQESQEKLDDQGSGKGRGGRGRGRGRGGRGRRGRGRGGRQQRQGQEKQGQQAGQQAQGQQQVQAQVQQAGQQAQGQQTQVQQQAQGQQAQGRRRGKKAQGKRGQGQQSQQAQGQQSQGNNDENLPTPPAVSGQAKQEFAGASGHEEAPSKVQDTKVPVRSVGEESEFFYDVDEQCFGIKKGFVPNMNVDGLVFVNGALRQLLFEELKQNSAGGFLPAVKQVGNVASLPGIVRHSIGLPDIHSGYGFAIGNVAAFDMSDPEAIVSPGGVGFDINCGVRMIRTNLTEDQVAPYKEDLCEALYKAIPVGVGEGYSVKTNAADLDQILNNGVDFAIQRGFAWEEDKEFCEERGHMANADSSKVSTKAKTRGKGGLGSLGAGNHYCEVQVVDEVFDEKGAAAMGLKKGQVCVMVHCGSRGVGHQVATDYLQIMGKTMHQQGLQLNDRQLACARINSQEGQDYLAAMACSANFAWTNRQGITYQIREVFSKMFGKSARDLDMKLIYDVSHNVAKVEDHNIDGQNKKLLVHRKGATRAFAPNHPSLPEAYKEIGQPIFIGGTMGTASYVLLGTQKGMERTFGSTCHGAGRCLSRHKSHNVLKPQDVLDNLKKQGISIRIQTPKLVMEEAPETYKDVHEVINTCEQAGISKKCVRMRPIAVIKG